VRRRDIRYRREVRDRPRQLEDAVVRPGRQPHSARGASSRVRYVISLYATGVETRNLLTLGSLHAPLQSYVADLILGGEGAEEENVVLGIVPGIPQATITFISNVGIIR
jgi:hypothetical protein